MLLACVLALMLPGSASAVVVPTSARAEAAARRVLPALRADLQVLGLAPGDPVFLRIFKREAQLELWLQPAASDTFVLFRSYPICHFSGTLGPKTREGDGQAPEGVYVIAPGQLNPFSQFHLSFNLGYPNAYEQGQGWTGSALMVHGNCVSVGCYAMTDPLIEEIYTLLAAALSAGQPSVPVHSFPFRLTADALHLERGSAHYPFWRMLAPIHAAFESRRVPPRVRVTANSYRLAD